MTDINWKELAESRLAAKRVEIVPFAINEDGTPAAATLKTKSAGMSGVLAAMTGMSHEDMMKWLHDAVQMPGLATAAQNAASIKAKGSAVKEDVKSILGDELNEETIEKVAVLIENAVDVQSALARAVLEEEFATLFEEVVTEQLGELAEKVDEYVTYAAEHWVEKNQVAIERTVMVEKAERLIGGLMALMAEAGIDVPEDQVDVVAEMADKIEALEAKLEEAVGDNIDLATKIDELEAAEVFRQVSEGLALTEVERFKKLVEDVEIGGDPDDLKKKLEIIRNAHFKESRQPVSTGINEQVDVDADEVQPEPKRVVGADGRIDRLADALSRASVNRYSGFRS